MPTFSNFISLLPGAGNFIENAKIALVFIVLGLAIGLMGGFKWGRSAK